MRRAPPAGYHGNSCMSIYTSQTNGVNRVSKDLEGEETAQLNEET